MYSQECELGGSALTGTKAIGSRIGLTLHHYITFCGSRWVVSRHIIPGLTLLSNWALYQVLSVQNNNDNSNITFVQSVLFQRMGGSMRREQSPRLVLFLDGSGRPHQVRG